MPTLVTFDDDILPILGPYRDFMINHHIATPDGVMVLDLTNYESVKALNARITIALHGHETGRESSHPMPPRGPLPPEKLNTWDAWVEGGMIKSRPQLA